MSAFLLLIFLVVTVISSQATPLVNVGPTKIEVASEDFLRIFANKVKSEFQTDDEVCTDLYSYFCKQSQPQALKNYNFKENIKNEFSNLLPLFSNILNSNDDKSRSVNVEQNLKKNCMKLDEETEKNVENMRKAEHTSDLLNRFSIETLFNSMLEKFGEKVSEDDWKKLDDKLDSLGFGRTFFDINVVDNFLEAGKKIILLEPPAAKEWNAKKFPDISADVLMQLQMETFEYCKSASESLYGKRKSRLEAEIENPGFTSDAQNKSNLWFDEFDKHENTKNLTLLCKPFQNLSLPFRDLLPGKDKDILEIYSQMIKFIFDIKNIRNSEPEYQSFTIESWIKVYNQSVRNDISRLDWLQIFKNKFEPFGISVNNDTSIIVKNKPYFSRLSLIMRYFSNQHIVHAIRLKFVSYNIRYYDWHWAQSVDRVEKSSFCFQETKLYGVTDAVIQLLKTEYLQSYLTKIKNVKNNIVKALHDSIFNTTSLTQIQKKHLQSVLKTITDNIIENDWNEEIVSKLYEHVKVTGNYFFDIINYRKSLKNKNLLSLQDGLSVDYLPFSINEIEKPRNRFVFHTLLNAIAARPIFLSPSIFEETYYATYGVNMGAFLYSLLKENKLQNVINDNLYDRQEGEWLLPHGTYSQEAVNCFIPKNTFTYGYKLAHATITETFGARIAYEAMLNDSKNNSTKDFFASYVQTQCSANDKKMTNGVLSSFKEIYPSFNCSDTRDEQEKCNLKAFDV